MIDIAVKQNKIYINKTRPGYFKIYMHLRYKHEKELDNKLGSSETLRSDLQI